MNALSDILRAAADRLDGNGGDVGEVLRVLRESTPSPFGYSPLKKGGESENRAGARGEEQRIVDEIVNNAMYGT